MGTVIKDVACVRSRGSRDVALLFATVVELDESRMYGELHG